MITVFNKVDLLADRTLLSVLKQRFSRAVFTSALKGMGLEMLRREIVKLFEEEEVEEEIRIPVEETRTIATIHRMVTVVEKIYKDGIAVIRFRAVPQKIRRIRAFVEKFSGDAHTHRG